MSWSFSPPPGYIMSALRSIMAALALALMGGCSTENVITDDFSTELTIVAAGNPGDDFEIRKRFRFSTSPAEARGFEVVDGLIAVLEPQGQDLTFLHRLSVYAESPDGTERVLLAVADDFEAGENWSVVRPALDEDIREYVAADSRLTLVFVVEPNAFLTAEFPENGITVLARAAVEILL